MLISHPQNVKNPAIRNHDLIPKYQNTTQLSYESSETSQSSMRQTLALGASKSRPPTLKACKEGPSLQRPKPLRALLACAQHFLMYSCFILIDRKSVV